MTPRHVAVTALTVLACRDHVGGNTRASPAETAIARDLTARFGTPVTARCAMAGRVPVGCTATLADGTKLPIALENASKEAWGWRVDGLVVESAAIAEYVQGQLAALGRTETVTCGPRIWVLQPGERISCSLSGGGAAFVRVGADGATELELALDADSAAARSELVTPDRDRQLTEQSRALQVLEWESDGEDAIPTDGGAPGGSLDRAPAGSAIP